MARGSCFCKLPVILSVGNKRGQIASKEPPSRHPLTNPLSFLIQGREGRRGVQGALVSSLSLLSSMGGGADELAFDKGAAGSAEHWI